MRKCVKCKYSGIIGTNQVVCDFILRTGHRRGCPADKCDKFEPRREKRAKQKKTAERTRRKNRGNLYGMEGVRTRGQKKDMGEKEDSDS